MDDDSKRLLTRMNGNEVVNTSGALALLLQFAHPLVAAGVGSTRKFHERPRARLQHTAGALQALMTSSPEKATQIAQHLAKVHQQTTGMLSEDVGEWKAGTPYTASDPQLMLWVYTTLVVSRVRTFSALVQPLSPGEEEAFYRSTFAFGEHFSLTEPLRPESYKALLHYYHSMLERLAVGSQAKELAQAFFVGVGPGAGIVQLVVNGLLPENVRQAYQFTWGWQQQWQARLCRPLVTKLPPLLERYARPWHLPWSMSKSAP